MVMATGVERTATPTRAGRERKREVETAQQEHPEEVGSEPLVGRRRASDERQTRERATLGTEQRTLRWETGEHDGLEEMILNARGRDMLPTLQRETGSIHVESLEDRTITSQGSFRPRRRREPKRNQLITASCSGNEMAMARNLGERRTI